MTFASLAGLIHRAAPVVLTSAMFALVIAFAAMGVVGVA